MFLWGGKGAIVFRPCLFFSFRLFLGWEREGEESGAEHGVFFLLLLLWGGKSKKKNRERERRDERITIINRKTKKQKREFHFRHLCLRRSPKKPTPKLSLTKDSQPWLSPSPRGEFAD